MRDPIQKRIDARIKVKDEREDAKQRAITVSWAINAAINYISRPDHDGDLELNARQMLRLHDTLSEERSQEQARKYEEYDEAKNSAELDTEHLI